MTRDELIAYIDGLTDRSGLLDLVLDQLRADAATIDDLTRRNLTLTKDVDSLKRALDFDRGQAERRVDEIRQRWQESDNRLRASIDRTNRIGVAVLKAQQARRKTVRIDELIGGETWPRTAREKGRDGHD